MAGGHSIGGYTFAAGLHFLELTGWQASLALIVSGLVGRLIKLAAGRP